MSMESANKFVAKMIADESLKKQVSTAVDGKNEAVAATAFVSLGKEHGFDFTPDEAIALYHQAMQPDEMSGAELSGVSGGGGPRGGPSLQIGPSKTSGPLYGGGSNPGGSSNPVASTPGPGVNVPKPGFTISIPSLPSMSY